MIQREVIFPREGTGGSAGIARLVRDTEATLIPVAVGKAPRAQAAAVLLERRPVARLQC